MLAYRWLPDPDDVDACGRLTSNSLSAVTRAGQRLQRQARSQWQEVLLWPRTVRSGVFCFLWAITMRRLLIGLGLACKSCPSVEVQKSWTQVRAR